MYLNNYITLNLKLLMEWPGIEDRGTASITSSGDSVCLFDTGLKAKVENLAMTIYGCSPFSSFSLPSDYTEELFGVMYLYAQSRRQLVNDETDIDGEIDKGFSEILIWTTSQVLHQTLRRNYCHDGQWLRRRKGMLNNVITALHVCRVQSCYFRHSSLVFIFFRIIRIIILDFFLLS